jgi:hypothetical protein
MRVILELENGRHLLRCGENLVGRDPACEVHLPFPTVSRRHLRLVVDPQTGSILVEDLASRNGTLVNGAPLRRMQALTEGDVLLVGGVAVRVQLMAEDGQWITIAGTNAPPETGDRRLHLRVPSSVIVQYCGARRNCFGSVHHLSLSGMFVTTPLLEPLGTRCRVALLPAGTRPLWTRGFVRRVTEASLEHPPGMGVAFEALEIRAWDWIRAEVDRQLSRLSPGELARTRPRWPSKAPATKVSIEYHDSST